MQFGWAHQAVPCYPRAESSAGALRGAYPRGIRRHRAKATGVLPKASSRSRMGKSGSEGDPQVRPLPVSCFDRL
ncbi:hypothetical protein ppKF707_3191 [Metapseudomonas furukawaii]|uniref:Uncharacterized protein n=1 Tax=Metapseudomonas furukawaii TaxID=1149133 RepID=A0AAD1FDJ7_METFU|nr:hypothetical protein ppKF707_3191 [Pseudomonas furukawaii]BAU72057.1 hypothetical protein KF707C_3690 [Pseudomonas furukawaii]